MADPVSGEEGEGAGSRTAALMPVARLAEATGRPASLFRFLEREVGEVRPLRTARGLAYREADAALLVGMAEALYGEGRALSAVREALAAGEHAALRALGRELLPPEEAGGPHRKPIPNDAIVAAATSGAATTASAKPAPVLTPGASAVLRELMACIDLLGRAR